MKQQDNHIVNILSEFSSWCLCDDDSCDKSRNFDNSVRQIEDFYRNKIPEKVVWVKNVLNWNRSYVNGYNQAIDDTTAQFNSEGNNDEQVY